MRLSAEAEARAYTLWAGNSVGGRTDFLDQSFLPSPFCTQKDNFDFLTQRSHGDGSSPTWSSLLMQFLNQQCDAGTVSTHERQHSPGIFLTKRVASACRA